MEDYYWQNIDSYKNPQRSIPVGLDQVFSRKRVFLAWEEDRSFDDGSVSEERSCTLRYSFFYRCFAVPTEQIDPAGLQDNCLFSLQF